MDDRFSARRGTDRVIYRIDDKARVVTVVDLAHRDVYRTCGRSHFPRCRITLNTPNQGGAAGAPATGLCAGSTRPARARQRRLDF